MKKTVTQSGNTTTKEYRSGFEFAGSNLEAYYHEEGRLTQPKAGGVSESKSLVKKKIRNNEILL